VHEQLKDIYHRHNRPLYAMALSVTGRPELAEDAVHEAFWRLCRNGGGRATVPYVYKAVRNAAIDQVRRAPREKPAGEYVSLFDGPDGDEPDVASESAELAGALRQAVEALPDAQKQAVLMKIYGGMTFAEIAEVTGEPLQTIASRYRRALLRLQETCGRWL
jgi:RNA polymerase sigma-70 factor (ECF subfamily)